MTNITVKNMSNNDDKQSKKSIIIRWGKCERCRIID